MTSSKDTTNRHSKVFKLSKQVLPFILKSCNFCFFRFCTQVPGSTQVPDLRSSRIYADVYTPKMSDAIVLLSLSLEDSLGTSTVTLELSGAFDILKERLVPLPPTRTPA